MFRSSRGPPPQLTGRNRSGQPPPQITSPSPSPALRLSVSLSTILLLYRFLFRFLSRLRAHLLAAQVEPFRRRNPRTSAALTSPYAPAVGASLAGLALGVCPAQQLRVTIAIYALFRALEFGWNVCETEGLVWGSDARTGRKRERPWWFGSWMLQPLAFGQLLHAVAFDRDCFAAVSTASCFLGSPPLPPPLHFSFSLISVLPYFPAFKHLLHAYILTCT